MSQLPIPIEQNDLPFEQWARARYQEIIRNMKFVNEAGVISPLLLNKALSEFSQGFSWAITVSEVEQNKLNLLIHEQDNWQKIEYNRAQRMLREEGGGIGRAPSQAAVEARIVQMNQETLLSKMKAIENQKSRVELLRGFVKVLDRHASILQTLCSNLRSEMFFAGGVPTDRVLNDNEKNNRLKTIVRQAMGQSESEESEGNQGKEGK